jgi:ABC-type phosphate/phosphonate transport system substrate-binding protein
LGRTDESIPRSRRARAWLLSTAAAIAALVLIGLCVPGLSGRTRVLLWTSPANAGPPGGRVLKVGCLGTGRERLPRELELQAARLAKHLQPVGIAAIEVVPLASYDRLRAAFEEGELDVFLGSAYPGLRLVHEMSARLLLERASTGRDDGRALWVVDAQSRHHLLADLAGQRVAFVDRYGASRGLEALSALLDAGLDPVRVDVDGSSAPRQRSTGFVFSGDAETSLLWLRSGRIDAVAVDGCDLREGEIGLDGTLRILGRGAASAPREVVVARLGLDPPITKALFDELGRASALDPQGVLRFAPPSEGLLHEVDRRLARWSRLYARFGT